MISTRHMRTRSARTQARTGALSGSTPFIPNGVVRFEQAHVGKPYLRRQQFRLVGAGEVERLIDPLQHLARLRRDVPDRIGQHAADIDDATVLDDLADDRTAGHDLVLVANNGHAAPVMLLARQLRSATRSSFLLKNHDNPRNSASITSPTPCEASLITFSESCPNA